MNAILSDAHLAKIVVLVLLGLIAVLALAVIFLAIKKNQIIYVEKESDSTPQTNTKIQPVEVQTVPEETTVVKSLPLVDNTPVVEDVEEMHTKVMTPITADPVEEPKQEEEPSQSVAGYANQVIKGVAITVTIGNQSTDANVTSFPSLLGREADKCDVIISEPAVSRKHARLLLENGDVFVEDVSEHNGTYLNEMKLPPLGRARIHEGDVIVLGRAKIRVNHYIY